jgi:hypothetical protein
MIFVVKSLLSSVLILWHLPCAAKVTAQELVETDAWGRSALVAEINSLSKSDRRRIASEAVALLDKEFATRQEYHRGGILFDTLPRIADDDILAEALRPYLDNPDPGIRRDAIEALSEGRGSASARLLSERIGRAYEALPTLPLKASDQRYADFVNDNGFVFLSCLKSLLRSDSIELRDTGKRYFDLFRRRYSTNEEGIALVNACLGELEKAGLASETSAVLAATVPTNSGSAPGESALPTRNASLMTSPSRRSNVGGGGSLGGATDISVWPPILGGSALLVMMLLFWIRAKRPR